jgi:hypothetical protein
MIEEKPELKPCKHQSILSEPIRARIEDQDFFNDLMRDVNAMNHPYKNLVYHEAYLLRDRALLCALILTGLRITELLQVQWNQVKETTSFVKLLNLETEQDDYTRLEILMPRRGRLGPFTTIFDQWYHYVLHQVHRWHDTRTHRYYVFPLGVSGLKRHRHYNKDFEIRLYGFYWNEHLDRTQAFRLIHESTGHNPRFYREAFKSYYGRLVCNRDHLLLQQALGYRQRDYNTEGVRGATEQEKQRLLTL